MDSIRIQQIILAIIAIILLACGVAVVTGCSAFDMANLQHTETLSHETIIDTQTLQDAGFTEES